jgi:hypothetical protein
MAGVLSIRIISRIRTACSGAPHRKNAAARGHETPLSGTAGKESLAISAKVIKAAD